MWYCIPKRRVLEVAIRNVLEVDSGDSPVRLVVVLRLKRWLSHLELVFVNMKFNGNGTKDQSHQELVGEDSKAPKVNLNFRG